MRPFFVFVNNKNRRKRTPIHIRKNKVAYPAKLINSQLNSCKFILAVRVRPGRF
jgi:hypothetical protein